MKVSVIVTTYNNPDSLERVLDSLLNQESRPWEIIVADDGSTQETRLLVESISRKCNVPIIHTWQEDKGFRAAHIRNKAVADASGDYIIFLDGDCITSSHFISDHLRLAQRGYFVQGKRVLVDRKTSSTFNQSHANSFWTMLAMCLAMRISNSHHILRLPWLPSRRNVKLKGIKSCNMGVFKDDAIAVNGFNEAFVGWGREDSEFATRLFKFGVRRKEHWFMAACYHLWHEENKKENLDRNEDLLRASREGSEYWCREGIIKQG